MVIMNDVEWSILSYYVICYEKFKKDIERTEKVALKHSLTMFTPSSFTQSFCSIVATITVNWIALLPVTIKWNIEGLAYISLYVNQSIEMLPSATNFWIASWMELEIAHRESLTGTVCMYCDILHEYICIWRSVWLISIVWLYLIWCLA